jgi:hypothetical protein
MLDGRLARDLACNAFNLVRRGGVISVQLRIWPRLRTGLDHEKNVQRSTATLE